MSAGLTKYLKTSPTYHNNTYTGKSGRKGGIKSPGVDLNTKDNVYNCGGKMAATELLKKENERKFVITIRMLLKQAL